MRIAVLAALVIAVAASAGAQPPPALATPLALTAVPTPVPTPHSTMLTWTAGPPVAGVTVAGFNVYRSATAGGESGTTPINGATPIPPSATAFTDATVVAGATSFYIVEAQSATGALSPPSNEIRILTPGLTITTATATPKGANTIYQASWTDTQTNSTFYALFGSGRIVAWGANVFHVSWTGATLANPYLSVCDSAGNCETAQP
jgi:hypothetical protein